MLNTFAALASATTLFLRTCRSIDCTPNAICGCWSMKRSWLFCGVRTSRYLDIGSLLYVAWLTTNAHRCGCKLDDVPRAGAIIAAPSAVAARPPSAASCAAAEVAIDLANTLQEQKIMARWLPFELT